MVPDSRKTLLGDVRAHHRSELSRFRANDKACGINATIVKLRDDAVQHRACAMTLFVWMLEAQLIAAQRGGSTTGVGTPLMFLTMVHVVLMPGFFATELHKHEVVGTSSTPPPL